MLRDVLRLIVCAALLAALPLWAAEPVRIGILSSPLKPWQPLAAELKRQIPDRDFEIEMLTHDELAMAVESRHLDFVLTNPGHYLLMQRRSGLSSPLATLVNDDAGNPLEVLGGTIICRAERTDINKLKDIRGKTVAYISLSALGGYQAQAYELVMKGFDLQQDVHWLEIGASHEKVIEAVLNGKADVGFVRAGQIENMVRNGKLDATKLRVLNQQDLPDFPYKVSTHLYPEWPFAALPHTDQFVARRVTAALLLLDRTPALPQAMQIHGFTVPADYQLVEDMLVKLRLPPFDIAYRITLKDVWKQHRWEAITALITFVIILMLVLRLLVSNRRIAVEKAAVQEQTSKLRLSEQSLLQMNIALHDSEERWRFALEGAGDGVWDWDVVSGKASFSKRWKEIIGYAENEFADNFDAWAESLHPDDKQRVLSAIQDYFEGKVAEYRVEFRMRCKDGGWRWILARGMVVGRDAKGSPLRMIGTHTDISERREAEQRLADSENYLRTIFQNEPECIKIVDADGRISQMNPAGLAMIEADSLEQIKGKAAVGIVAPEYRRMFVEMHQRVLAGESEKMQFEIIGLKGTRRILESSAVPIVDHGAVALLAVARDITERKRIQDALEGLNRDFVALLENTSDFLYFKDRESRIRFCSQSMANIVGHKNWRELIGKHDLEIFPPETAKVYFEEEFPVFNEGRPLLNKVDPYFDAEGNRGWVSTNKWPVFESDGKTVAGIFGISRDITEQVESEMKLTVKTQELLQSNADLERFAYSVSHDMRQPLRAISGHLQLLQHGLYDKLDEEGRQNLSFALDGARRMDSMIVSLLDYSRVGRKTGAMQWIASHVPLDDAMSFLSPLVAETGTEVKVNGDWPQVYASRDELTRLMQNLIGNAIKFRRPEISAQVVIDSSVTGNGWRVSVRDNGIGIDPQQAGRLFQFFSRLQSRTRYEGNGMGLALCRRIVEHHGGRIWVESEGEGKGCDFVFELPIGKVDPKNP